MVQNVNECLSKYLLNHITFWYQTWYNDAASWARVSSRKKIVCCLQGQGHNKGSFDQNVTLSTMSSELLILQQPNLVWWYMIISQNVLWKNWYIVFEVKVRVKGQNVSFYPDDIFLTAEHFVTKLGVVMQHHELGGHGKRLDCNFLGQGHSMGSYDQFMTISAVSFELLILLLSNLVW